MGARFEFLHGWRSPRLRVVLLAIGWALLGFAVAAVLVGAAGGDTATLIGGIALGGSARFVSWIAPEPLPSAHKHVRRRVATLAKVSGHELPSKPRGSVPERPTVWR